MRRLATLAAVFAAATFGLAGVAKAEIFYSFDGDLVGYWSFDDSNGGLDATDDSGTGNDGTVTGATADCADTPPTALNTCSAVFDIDADSVQVASPTFIDDSQGTWAAWVKLDDSGVDDPLVILAISTDGSLDDEFLLQWQGNATADPLRLAISQNNNFNTRLDGDTSMSSTDWAHVAATSDGSTIKMYVNGVLQTITVINGSNTGQWFGTATDADTFTIGGVLRATLAGDFGGKIGEVRVYDVALTDDQIALLASGQPEVEPGLTKVLTSGDLANRIDPLVDGEDEDFDEDVDLPDGEPDLVVQVGSDVSTAADFTITYVPEEGAPPVVILDTVPAEWDVTAIDGDSAGELPIVCGDSIEGLGDDDVLVSRGGKFGKNCRSATNLAWEPDDEAGGDILVDVTTRVNPGKGHAKHDVAIYSPTSCGPLALNDGATAFEIDEEGNLVLIEVEEGVFEPVIIAQSDPLILVGVADVNGDGVIDRTGAGDEDGDGLTDAEEALDIGTNPCEADTDDDGVDDGDEINNGTDPLDNDSDNDGVLDGADSCPLEGPADANLGEILQAKGCLRQSQCSDGIDNDNDGPIDFAGNDESCDNIIDDSEDTTDPV